MLFSAVDEVADCFPRVLRFGKSLVKNTSQKTTKLYSGVQNTGSPYDPARSGTQKFCLFPPLCSALLWLYMIPLHHLRPHIL